MAQFFLHTSGNRITIQGPLRTKDVRRVLAAMHNLINSLGYQDIELDFGSCTATFSGPMLSLAAYAERYLINGIDVDLTLPSDLNLQRLFLNTNWAHLIDPRRYEPSRYKGRTQIPAIKYASGIDQHTAVQSVMTKMLSALADFDRSHLKAIEWSLNEITDNVLNHARS